MYLLTKNSGMTDRRIFLESTEVKRIIKGRFFAYSMCSKILFLRNFKACRDRGFASIQNGTALLHQSHVFACSAQYKQCMSYTRKVSVYIFYHIFYPKDVTKIYYNRTDKHYSCILFYKVNVVNRTEQRIPGNSSCKS